MLTRTRTLAAEWLDPVLHSSVRGDVGRRAKDVEPRGWRQGVIQKHL